MKLTAMTPEQHLAMIRVIRTTIDTAGGPNQTEAERMIRNHEVMARVRHSQLERAAAQDLT